MEVWAWVEEDVHSDKAVGFAVPTMNKGGRSDTSLPGETAKIRQMG